MKARVSTLAGMGTTLLILVVLSGCRLDSAGRTSRYIESGRNFQSKGRDREAVIEFRNALKHDNNSADAHYGLALSYMRLHIVDGAITELRRTVSLQPNNRAARIDLAGLCIGVGLLPEASQEAKTVLTANPQDADAHALLADVAYASGNREASIAELKQAISIAEDRAAFHASLGTIFLDNPKNREEAEKEVRRAIALDGKNAQAHAAYSVLLRQRGDLDGAAGELQAAIAADAFDPQRREALARLYEASGKALMAEQVLLQAAEALPENKRAASLPAEYYLRTHQLDRAVSVYARLNQAHPKSVPLRLAYANTLLAQGNFAQAERISAALRKDSDGDPEIAALNASILAHTNRSEEAVSVLQASLRANPNSVRLYLQLGSIARERGDLALAQTSYTEALARDPAGLDASRGLAEIASTKGDLNTLRQLAAGALARDAQSSDAYLWRATAEGGDGQMESAADDFSTALRLSPESEAALVGLGEMRYRQGRKADAEAFWSRAALASGKSRALPLLVRLNLENQRPAKAIEVVRAQISRTPGNAGLWSLLSTAQLSLGDMHASLESAQQAVTLDPASAAALRTLTQVQIAAGDVASAVSSWERYQIAHPNNAEAPATLGMLYESAGEHGKAMEAYRRSLQLNPEQPVASSNLAALLVETGGDLDVALSLAQSAHRALPDSAGTSDTLAWVLYQKGIYGSALDLLQQAVLADPANAMMRYHLALTMTKLNRKSDAAVQLRKAADLARDEDLAKEVQRELAHLG